MSINTPAVSILFLRSCKARCNSSSRARRIMSVKVGVAFMLIPRDSKSEIRRWTESMTSGFCWIFSNNGDEVSVSGNDFVVASRFVKLCGLTSKSAACRGENRTRI